MDQATQKFSSIFYLIIFSLLVFIAARLFGAYLFDHNWSFTHWQFIPLWYLIGWAVVSSVILYLIFSKAELLSKLMSNKIYLYGSGFVLMALMIIFGSDSFLFNGGNGHINQIAQLDTTMVRWFEAGYTLVGSFFFFVYSLLTSDNNLAGYFSLKTVSYLGVLFTLPAAYKISAKLTDDLNKRLLLFLILFFGPHTILYFGHFGPETGVIAFIYWFVLLSLDFGNKFESKKTVTLILLVLAGLFFHVSLFILIPSLVFVLMRTLFKSRSIVPLVAGLGSFLIALYLVFYYASINFEYAQQILQPNGPDISNIYHLFSIKHIGDIFQIALLSFPTFIILKFLFFKKFSQIKKDNNLLMLLLLVTAGNSLMVILEPVNSIVLDFPRLLTTLAPLGILVAYFSINFQLKSVKLLAATAIIIPLSVLPIYNNLSLANDYTEDYLKKNDIYYIITGKALQDSFHYKKQMNEANYWYLGLPKFSKDYLDFTAATELTYAGIFPEAIKKLNLLKTKYPFWGEPRALLANIQVNLNRSAQAKIEIDTLLMMAPYNKDYMYLDYVYYRGLNNFSAALLVVEKMIDAYPNDNTIKEDQAICYLRLNHLRTADSLSSVLTEADPNLAYPYYIRGVIAEFQKDDNRAIANFEKFIKLAPEEGETPAIRKKLNNLILKRMENN